MNKVRRFNPFGMGAERRVPGEAVLPADLLPKFVHGEEDIIPSREAGSIRKYFGNALYISKNIIGRTITVGAVPTLIISEPIELPHLVMNFTITGLIPASILYLGNTSGVSTVSGYPILEGQEKIFILGADVELWAVSNLTIDVRIFTL